MFDGLKRALAERALNAEMDHHMKAEAGDGHSNSRNGHGKKTLLTETGTLDISIPRDRLATFDPQPIAEYRRRVAGFDEKIVSIYPAGDDGAREFGMGPPSVRGPCRSAIWMSATASTCRPI